MIKKLLEYKKANHNRKMALFGITSRTVKSDIKSINHELSTKDMYSNKAEKEYIEILPEKEYYCII